VPRKKLSLILLMMIIFLSGCLDFRNSKTDEPVITPAEQNANEIVQLKKELGQLKEEAKDLQKIVAHLQSNLATLSHNNAEISLWPPDSQEGVVERYLLANTVDEKLNYILDADKLRHTIRNYYKYGLPVFDLKDITIQSKIRDGKWYIVRVLTTTGGRTFSSNFYLQETSEGCFVDWEVSTGYNSDPTISNFTNSKTDKPASFKMLLRLADSYKYEFSPNEIEFPEFKEEYYFSVFDENAWYNEGFPLYVERNSKVGSELMNILRDGNKHQLTVLVRRVTEHCYVIDDLVSPNWHGGNYNPEDDLY